MVNVSSGYEDYAFVADLYDYVVPYRERRDVGFFVEAATAAGSPVLELGCGTGRITMAIAEAGQQITGLDNSEKMLQRAEQKVAGLRPEQRQRVTLLPGDMRRFALHQQFPSIIIPFRPFQHLLPVREQLDCLGCVRQHLAPGGKLIMDFFQTDAARMHDPEFLKEHFIAEYEMPGGRKVRLSERIIDPDRAFVSYMRSFKGVKVGQYLQQWITLAQDNGIKLEVAKRHVRDWIDRNRCALKQ